MTREAIRRGIRHRFRIARLEGPQNPDWKGDVDVDDLLAFLHSQDVGIKGQCLGGSHPHLSAYYTFEPLIEEV